jgi:hypothetical protein
MGTTQVVALLGGVVVAFCVKLSNVLLEALAKILGVNPPTPIPEPDKETPP